MKINNLAKDFAIKSNFDVSVVMPFYKKSKDFAITIEKNYIYFQRNGIEVVIVMDEPSEKEILLSLVKKYPLINWKIIINENAHPWRNPTKAINVGIRNAIKKYVLIMGPDSEMAHDIILDMRKAALFYDNSFFTGKVAFIDYDSTPSMSELKKLHFWDYGSLFVKREFLVAVGGYDESYETWGGDDDNIRARLQMFGLRKLKLNSCILLHREDKNDLKTQRKKEKSSITGRNRKELRQSFYPCQPIANSTKGNWGYDFSSIIYDWNNNTYSEDLCFSYLRVPEFEKFEVKKQAFEKRHQIIALISAYNEEKHILESIQHVSKHCDGIILLDDSSNDRTYDLAQGEKLLLKVRKKNRIGFNDLLNRNILLDIASFFKTEFYFFIDVDERFDPRYSDLYTLARSNESEAFCFYLVHLWNKESEYRTDVPERSPINQPGILHRWRMFKNNGRMQIIGNRLHFEATPFRSRRIIAPVLIKHYGMLHQQVRSSKYKLYQNEDEHLNDNPNKYKYFLDKEIQVNKVSNIKLPKESVY